jgi:hypothetical protein
LIKNYKALEDSLQKKFAVLHEKRQTLDNMMNEQEALAKVINEAEDAEKTVNEKQKELEDLIKRQEADLKDLAVRKEAAAKAWEDGDKNYSDQYEHAQKYIEEYEYIEKMFNDRDLISEQKLEDLVDYTKHQQDKLSQDAEKQKAYIREKQSKECRVIRADLLNLKQFLTEVERPKGIFKISNSRAFTELRNTMMEYLEISVMVKDPENPGQKKPLTNPSEVITLLECMDGQERFHVTDKQRTEYLTKIADAMDKIAEASDKYLKAKGSPYRETELGRARYEMACEVRAYAKKAAFKVKGMLREEQYCLDAPNLGLVTEKSGLKEADYVKVDGYRYVRGDVQREEAIMHADALMQLKDAADHDKLMDELQRAKDEKNMLMEKEQGPVMN